MLGYAHSKEGENMSYRKPTPTRMQPLPFDAVAEFIDSQGRAWSVGASFKSINGRLDITALSVTATEGSAFVTRRLLRDLPLDDMFRDSLTAEETVLERATRTRKGSTAHQGRPHSDEELQAVADIYQAAYRAHRPVQRAVADALGVSLSTAAKRIMASRRRGFIPTSQGENQS